MGKAGFASIFSAAALTAVVVCLAPQALWIAAAAVTLLFRSSGWPATVA
jgi:hypothetical protein